MLSKIIKTALTNAEIHANKCLASENFYLKVPMNLAHVNRIMGFKVIASHSATNITLVPNAHVKVCKDFKLAIQVFNEEMKHATTS